MTPQLQSRLREALEEARTVLDLAICCSVGTRATIHLTRAKQTLAKIDAALATEDNNG